MYYSKSNKWKEGNLWLGVSSRLQSSQVRFHHHRLVILLQVWICLLDPDICSFFIFTGFAETFNHVSRGGKLSPSRAHLKRSKESEVLILIFRAWCKMLQTYLCCCFHLFICHPLFWAWIWTKMVVIYKCFVIQTYGWSVFREDTQIIAEMHFKSEDKGKAYSVLSC